jgi:ATP-dependent Clp protease ATP-binding subunit ClpA
MLPRAADASLALIELEFEAVRHAVRLGHRQVSTAHLLLAILECDHQLSAAGASFIGSYQKNNQASILLHANRVTRAAVLEHLSSFEHSGNVAPERRHRKVRTRRSNPKWTRSAAEAADNSRSLARQRNEDAGSLHLLLSLLKESSTFACEMVHALGFDPDTILRDTERLLEWGC